MWPPGISFSKTVPPLSAILLAGFVFWLDLLGRFGHAIGVLYVAPVLLVGLCGTQRKPQMIAMAGVCSALIVIGFASPAHTSAIGAGVANRVLSLLAVWLAASLCVLHLRVEDYLDVTREFLPICASCKKIRDEEGQWHNLESYFSESFAVKFTHGICPDCTRQLYPEVVRKHLRYSDLMRRPSSPKPAPGPLAK